MVGRDIDALQGVAEEVLGLGRRVVVVKADLREPGEVAAMVHKARDFGGGRIDVLVNAAGVSARDPVPLWDQPVEDFARFFDTNVKGVFMTMKYVLPTMIGQKSGRIVNVAARSAIVASRAIRFTRPRNGPCAASLNRRRWRPAAMASASISLHPVVSRPQL